MVVHSPPIIPSSSYLDPSLLHFKTPKSFYCPGVDVSVDAGVGVGIAVDVFGGMVSMFSKSTFTGGASILLFDASVGVACIFACFRPSLLSMQPWWFLLSTSVSRSSNLLSPLVYLESLVLTGANWAMCAEM